MLQGKWQMAGYAIYLDESAGRHTACPSLRRAGWGVAFFREDDADTHLAVGIYSGVSGAEQTQNRAALEALLYLAIWTDGDVVVHPDATFLIKGWAAIGDKAIHDGRHVQLWADILSATRKRRGELKLIKVDAHVSMEQASQMQQLHHWVGNHWADRLAARGAEDASVDKNEEANYLNDIHQCKLIQKRAMVANAMAIQALPANEKWWRPATQPQELKLLADSGHCVQWKEGGKWAQCVLCKEQVKATGFTAWLKRRHCGGVEVAQGWEEPERLPPQISPLVGRHTLHPSHSLVYFRGVWVCWECRAYTCAQYERTRKLLEPCKHKRLVGHRDARKMVLRGYNPRTGHRLREMGEPELGHELLAGIGVAIAGLKTTAGKKFNGRKGILKHFDDVQGRWHVQLEGSGQDILLVRACCLIRLPPGEKIEVTLEPSDAAQQSQSQHSLVANGSGEAAEADGHRRADRLEEDEGDPFGHGGGLDEPL